MTINELREKRNQAWNAAKAFVETKRDKDGLLSDEDSATYAQMEKKVQDYGAEIERMEAIAAMEAQLSKPTSAPITEKPLNGKTTEDKQPKSFRATDAYRSGMLNALRTNFRRISNVLQEGIDANGGYLVPDEYDSRLIQVLNEENVMRSLGTAITTSGEHKINIAATKPAAAWIEEGGALTFGDATFDQIILDAHKLHVAVKVTEGCSTITHSIWKTTFWSSSARLWPMPRRMRSSTAPAPVSLWVSSLKPAVHRSV